MYQHFTRLNRKPEITIRSYSESIISHKVPIEDSSISEIVRTFVYEIESSHARFACIVLSKMMDRFQNLQTPAGI